MKLFFIAVHGEGGEDGKIQTLLENKKENLQDLVQNHVF